MSLKWIALCASRYAVTDGDIEESRDTGKWPLRKVFRFTPPIETQNENETSRADDDECDVGIEDQLLRYVCGNIILILRWQH